VAGRPTGGLVEQGAGGIERDGGRWHFTAAAAPRARGRDRVGGTQRVPVAVVERDRLAGEAGVGGDDGDDAASEEALVELPDAGVEVDGAVLANATAAMHGERGGERRLVDGAAVRAGLDVRLDGGALVRIPAGALWIDGPLPQVDDDDGSIADLLALLDPRAGAADWELFPFNVIREQTLTTGDRVEVSGAVSSIPLQDQAGLTYREAAPSVLAPDRLPVLRRVS